MKRWKAILGITLIFTAGFLARATRWHIQEGRIVTVSDHEE